MGDAMAHLATAINNHDLEAFVALFAADYRSEQPAHPIRSFRDAAPPRVPVIGANRLGGDLGVEHERSGPRLALSFDSEDSVPAGVVQRLEDRIRWIAEHEFAPNLCVPKSSPATCSGRAWTAPRRPG